MENEREYTFLKKKKKNSSTSVYIKERKMNSVIHIFLVCNGNCLSQNELPNKFPRETLTLSHK